MKTTKPKRIIPSFGRSVLAALLVSAGIPQNATALDFTFSFSNTIGHISGTVTGEIFGLTDNATSSATSVVIQSFPAGLNSQLAAPITATLWSNQSQNSFTVTAGQVTGGSFDAFNASNNLYLYLNASGLFNYITLDGSANFEVYNLDGFNGITFTLATPAVVTGSTLENAAPVGVGTNANFQVTGQTETAGGNNTVNTLSFLPGGSLTIHNTLFVTGGPVNLVNGSSIFLDGNLSTSQLNVLFGGMLHGAGTVFGNLVNGGNVTPGDAPGTITVTGNYTQTSNGTLSILLQDKSKSGHGLLQVGGRASLNGTLQLVSLDHFDLQPGSKITIVKAHGGIDGAFANIVDPYPKGTIIDPKVVYHDNSVQLVTQSFSQYASSHSLTGNQKAVAASLDSVVATGRVPSFLRYVDYRPLSELPADFDRIAPEELTSIFATSIAYAKVQSLNLQRRTDDLRSGSNGFSAAGLAINGDRPGYSGSFGITTGAAGPTGSEAKDSKVVQSTVTADSRWGAFLSGTGEWVNVSGDDNARGYNLESGGFTLGLDYRLCPNAVIGLALGYTGTTADLNDRGRVWTNGGKIGLYGTFYQNAPAPVAPTMSKDSSKDSSKEAPVMATPARGFYVDVAAFGGYNSFDTRRAGLQGDARGATDGGEIDALFGTGYDFKAGNLTFGPTATFNYTYAGSSAYTERGSLAPLDIHGGSGESLRTAFGFKASYDWKIGGLYIKPELSAAWQHEFGDASYALNANFANGSGDSFSVSGPHVSRDTALLNAGFAVQCSERCAVYFYYDGELGSDYHSNSVTGGIHYAF